MKYVVGNKIINTYVCGENIHSICICGQSGSGKGYFLAKFCQDIIRENKDLDLKFWIINANNYNWTDLIPERYILHKQVVIDSNSFDIESFFKDLKALYQDRRELCHRFGCSNIYDYNLKMNSTEAHQSKIYLVIDDLMRFLLLRNDKVDRDNLLDLLQHGHTYGIIPVFASYSFIKLNMSEEFINKNISLAIVLRNNNSLEEFFTKETIEENQLRLKELPGEFIARYGKNNFIYYCPNYLKAKIDVKLNGIDRFDISDEHLKLLQWMKNNDNLEITDPETNYKYKISVERTKIV